MKIPQGVILIWPGTNSSIPSGWNREIALDGKFPKAWGTQNPNETGGADTHSHTSSGHTHTIISHTHTGSFTGASGAKRDFAEAPGNASADGHIHNFTSYGCSGTSGNSGVVTWASSSNLPSYYNLIFIKAGLSSILQQNIIALWTGWQGNNNPPSNWQECNGNNNSPDLRNRYLRGANTGQDAGGTGGSNTHNHTSSHNHTISHNHTGVSGASDTPQGHRKYQGGGTEASDYNHTHTFTLSTVNETSTTYNATSDTQSNEPEHRKVMAIQFKTGAIKAKGIIGLWLGNVADIPKGWVLCDGNNGTIDLRNKFIKIANSSSEIGQTGGSNTHSHGAVSHNHTATSSHTHTGTVDLWGGYGYYNESGTLTGSLSSHTHNISSTSSVTTQLDNSNIATTSTADNQPPYRTVAYIQFQKEIYGGAILTNFL